MKVTVDREVADPQFLYYVLSSAEQQAYVRQHAIQTGVPHTNLEILRSTPIPVPPLTEQRAIAHILGTLDDKIELHGRMNTTLEAMARALFQSWFVDFDPVRAKMEGRETGLPKHIADLFPGRMVNSELGEIPVGWEVRPLGDLLDLAYGNPLKAGSPTERRAESRTRWAKRHLPGRGAGRVLSEHARSFSCRNVDLGSVRPSVFSVLHVRWHVRGRRQANDLHRASGGAEPGRAADSAPRQEPAA